MTGSLLTSLLWLLAGVAIIVVCTVRLRLHAFFALVLAAFVVGLGEHLPLSTVIKTVKDGFGNILSSLGLVIVLGTALGVLLEYTGCTRSMAQFILRKTGERRAALGMSITGFVVGLPIFCDSGFVVLSGLSRVLSKKTGTPLTVIAVSLATGLYSVHCLAPPHPGATAAAGIIDVDTGTLLLAGVVIALPAAMVGYLWAARMGRRFPMTATEEETIGHTFSLPSAFRAFLPVVVPLLLIALRSVFSGSRYDSYLLAHWVRSLGDPVLALAAGVVLACTCLRRSDGPQMQKLLGDAIEKAGGILVIIGAGGGFGAVLASMTIGKQLGEALPLGSLGILVPFLVTSTLKTAQGSSTVAIITAASIVQPLMPALSLDTNYGHLLCVLAMGAGSMMISHANDAYFWVIAKFSGLEMRPMLATYSVGSVLMALTALLAVMILKLILL